MDLSKILCRLGSQRNHQPAECKRYETGLITIFAHGKAVQVTDTAMDADWRHLYEESKLNEKAVFEM